MTELAWQVVVVIGLVAMVGAYVQAVVGLGLGLLDALRSSHSSSRRWSRSCRSGSPSWSRASTWPTSTSTSTGARTAWSLPARVPGTFVGAWLVAAFTEQQIGVVLAVMVLVAVGAVGAHGRVPLNPASLATAGFVAGATGTATSIGGPPIALLYQRERPEVVRADPVGLLLRRRHPEPDRPGDLGLARRARRPSSRWSWRPGVLVGYVVGRRSRSMVDGPAFRRAVLVVCTVSAVTLLVRSVV